MSQNSVIQAKHVYRRGLAHEPPICNHWSRTRHYVPQRKREKQKKRKLMFLNTYSMPGTWSLLSFNHPSSLGNIVGLIFTEETIGFEFNDLLKTTQLETFKLGGSCLLPVP